MLQALTLDTFDIHAERGAQVTREVYEYFLNIMPPISLHGGQGCSAGFQVGEAYSHQLDTRTGTLRPTYSTFAIRNGQPEYHGHNFAGELDSREFEGGAADPWS